LSNIAEKDYMKTCLKVLSADKRGKIYNTERYTLNAVHLYAV